MVLGQGSEQGRHPGVCGDPGGGSAVVTPLCSRVAGGEPPRGEV